MLAEVAVETAGGPGVRGKGRQRGGWAQAREMDAVMAQEDPAAVGHVGVAGQVRTGGRGDLHTPASAGVPCRQALPENGRLRETRSTAGRRSDDPGRTVPVATDP